MQGTCEKFLARAALSQEKHAHLRVGRSPGYLQDLGDLRADADDVAVPGLDLGAEAFNLAPQPLAFKGLADDEGERLHVEGFGEEVIGPIFHGFDRRMNGPVRRHHDDGKSRRTDSGGPRGRR